jgi:mRNA interferase HicA
LHQSLQKRRRVPQIGFWLHTRGSNATDVLYRDSVTSAEFKRWLGKQGCTFEFGKGGHLKVRRGSCLSVLPMHGSNKEIGKGLTERIKKDLGLK